MNWPRIIAFLLVIGFIVLLWTDPVGAADLVSGFFHGVGTGVGKIVTFFGALND